MKIKLYTLTTEDDGGTTTSVHASEDARDREFWTWLAATCDGMSADDLKRKYEDIGDAYEQSSDLEAGGWRSQFDSASWDECEIEIPDPVPDPILQAPIRDFCGCFGQALHDDDEISGSDAVEHLTGLWPAFHAAQKFLDNLSHPAPAETGNNGFAVIYESDEGDGERVESFYEVFGTPEEAEKLFREAYPPGERSPGYHAAHNPRLVAILKPLDGYDVPPSSAETGEDDPENPNRYTNFYECDCGTTWQDNWSCTCNDRCPSCNLEIEPWQSVDNDTHETIKH